jgi:hypothetical protein
VNETVKQLKQKHRMYEDCTVFVPLDGVKITGFILSLLLEIGWNLRSAEELSDC